VRKSGSRRGTRVKTRKKPATPVVSNEILSSEEFTPEQWERICAHIRARGMTIEVFLPEPLADWLRGKLAAGVFKDPGEAAFVAFQDLRELDRHPAIRKKLIKAMVIAGADSPRPGISFEKWRKQNQARLHEYANTEPPALNISNPKRRDN
jgi:hypothetical protein